MKQDLLWENYRGNIDQLLSVTGRFNNCSQSFRSATYSLATWPGAQQIHPGVKECCRNESCVAPFDRNLSRHHTGRKKLGVHQIEPQSMRAMPGKLIPGAYSLSPNSPPSTEPSTPPATAPPTPPLAPPMPAPTVADELAASLPM